MKIVGADLEATFLIPRHADRIVELASLLADFHVVFYD
jgi:hypothetical protein